jgi:hypothetical protein
MGRLDLFFLGRKKIKIKSEEKIANGEDTRAPSLPKCFAVRSRAVSTFPHRL